MVVHIAGRPRIQGIVDEINNLWSCKQALPTPNLNYCVLKFTIQRLNEHLRNSLGTGVKGKHLHRMRYFTVFGSLFFWWLALGMSLLYPPQINVLWFFPGPCPRKMTGWTTPTFSLSRCFVGRYRFDRYDGTHPGRNYHPGLQQTAFSVFCLPWICRWSWRPTFLNHCSKNVAGEKV